MKPIILTIIFLISFFNYSFSQQVNPKNYDAFIEEVYGGTPYMTDEHKEIYIQNMKKVQVKEWDGNDYPVLGTVMLKNKYHPEMDYDNSKTFDSNNFNPLKYFFNFYGKEKQIYKVYGTDYMVVIDPINVER